MVLVIGLGLSQATAAKHTFKGSSALSSGTWVKVRVAATGIYEISYSELQEMGFADPSAVGVFGKGGKAMPISFTDGSTSLISDDLNPVGAWHHDSKLYFYGLGPETISLNSVTAQFEKKSRNIYSDEGAYFLSDSADALFVSEEEKSGARPIAFSLGYDYIYHEKDIFQNTRRTGQLFWGEDLKNADGVKESYYLPLIDVNSKAYLDCRVYASDKSGGVMKYGVTEATGGNRTFNVAHPSPAPSANINPEFLHAGNPVASLTLPSDRAEVYVNVTAGVGDFINLDYWLMTYSKLTPDFSISPNSQERFSVLRKTARNGVFTIPDASNVEVFDVSDPASISLLTKEPSGEKTSFYFLASRPVHDFVFCNLDREQLKVAGWEKVDNSDLHALAANGADFLIITTPEFKDFADRLGALHRQYDNIEVIVATAPQLYNEFSGGIPDPMAYRAMTKLTYEASDGRLKNVLLVGRMLGDFRKAAQKENPSQYLIAFQDLKVTAETDASMVMDFYGLTDDFLYTSLQNNVMQVGVGLLPFYSLKEAEQYLRKAERYMADENKAEYLNEFLSIGGVGDNHTHDTQGVMLTEHWDTYTPSRQNNTSLPLDAYGEKEAKKKLMETLHKGQLLTTYFGHGDYRGPNSVYDFFRVGDLKDLKNKKAGFMLIMGCDLSDTDRLRRGFGEAVVTDTEYGMLGCLMSIRTSWSGQNFELAKLFSTSLFASPEKVYDNMQPGVARTKYHVSSPTIGEVYARSKTLSNYSNSLAYNYIGDPALVIPISLRHITSSVPSKGVRGEILKLRGNVAANDTIHLRDTLPINSYTLPIDPDFNGKVVAKVLSPDKSVVSNDYISNSKADGKELVYTEKGTQLAVFNNKVENGEFELDLFIPENMRVNVGERVQVLLSAYDYKRKLGATGCVEIEIASKDGGEAEIDATSPQVALSYDERKLTANLLLYDNMGLNSNGIKAYIDGQPAEPLLVEADDDWRSLEMKINADRLTEGEHILRVCARDQAGNVAEETLTFNVASPAATIFLTADRKASKEEITFSLDNELEGPWRLVITNVDGTEIFRKPFTGNTFRWNCVSTSGGKVAPGLYAAMVVAVDDRLKDNYSEKVFFAIIE